jgi:hypothetical protein
MNIPSKIKATIPSLIIDNGGDGASEWGQITGNIRQQEDLVEFVETPINGIYTNLEENYYDSSTIDGKVDDIYTNLEFKASAADVQDKFDWLEDEKANKDYTYDKSTLDLKFDEKNDRSDTYDMSQVDGILLNYSTIENLENYAYSKDEMDTMMDNPVSGGVTFDNDGKLAIVQEYESVPVRLRGSNTEGTWTGNNGILLFCRTGNTVTVNFQLYNGTLSAAEGDIELGPIPAKWRATNLHGGLIPAYIGAGGTVFPKYTVISLFMTAGSEWWKFNDLYNSGYIQITSADTASPQMHGSASYISVISNE